ncbi:hypothetical protein SYK_02880 [Pseudodesulfovibrio nedwellii]|uniref:Uncharacterized protein n=1 Tax=Pseudodesulfovibrio nedwellii TaxID=2973072 RepID=A0ABN6S1V9_9BACT|nr:DUF6682 family protein [Pseudodesulfovibrio nedwellii]BDQ35928.1 hypothetical protein SYK_02880 [Pseudodesulfovibrio nedwellii]
MKAKEIFLLVSAKLQDLGIATGERWPWNPVAGKASLVDFLNNGLRQIALNRPDSTSTTESVKLTDGVDQTIPDPAVHDGASRKALSLIEVLCNMGTDGTTPGDQIYQVTMGDIKDTDDGTLGTEVDNYAYDVKRNASIYRVYPGVETGESVYVKLTYSAEPIPIATDDDDITIPETFSGPLMHWILYEIFVGDNSDANFNKAQHHLVSFYQALGVKLKADLFFPVEIKEEGE